MIAFSFFVFIVLVVGSFHKNLHLLQLTYSMFFNCITNYSASEKNRIIKSRVLREMFIKVLYLMCVGVNGCARGHTRGGHLYWVTTTATRDGAITRGAPGIQIEAI